MAQIIDLLSDQEMVTASALPRVIPPRTDSETLELELITIGLR